MSRSHVDLSRSAVMTAAVCVCLLVGLYLLAVWTAAGQRFEDAVLAGAAATAKSGGHPDTLDRVGRVIAIWALRTVATPTLVAGTAVVIAIGFLRRRPLLGVLGAGVAAASVVTAEVLRWAALRPVLLEHGVRRADQSFPSGHTATAVSVMFGLVLVMPPRLRWYAAAVLAPWALAASVATVAVGWHRPSDTAGSEIIALFYACLAIVVAARRTSTGPLAPVQIPAALTPATMRGASLAAAMPVPASGPSTHPRRPSVRSCGALPIIVGTFAVISAIAVGFMFSNWGAASAVASPSSLAAYVAGQLIVLGSGVAVTAVLLTVLRGVDLADRIDLPATARTSFRGPHKRARFRRAHPVEPS